MSIDTGVFVTGVGLLVGLDILALGQIYALEVGVDAQARKAAKRAHERIDDHHGDDDRRIDLEEKIRGS